MRLHAVVPLLVAVLGWAAPLAAAEPLPKPDGRALLTVTGKIGVTNRGDKAVFDRKMLKNLPQAKLATHTDWTKGEQVFRGPKLATVLNRVEAAGATIKAVALNDYSATIPRSDTQSHKVVLAMTRNGERMTVRGKGPIWIVYPHPNPASDEPSPHNTKSVWQLTKLVVR